MTEQLTVLMSRGEAKTILRRIHAGLETARVSLLDLYDREGWRALSYESWDACVESEFGASRTHLYRLLNAGQIDRALQEPIGSTPEGHARELRPLKDDPEAVRDAYQEAVRVAAPAPVTANHVRAAVTKRLPIPKPTHRPQPVPVEWTGEYEWERDTEESLDEELTAAFDEATSEESSVVHGDGGPVGTGSDRWNDHLLNAANRRAPDTVTQLRQGENGGSLGSDTAPSKSLRQFESVPSPTPLDPDGTPLDSDSTPLDPDGDGGVIGRGHAHESTVVSGHTPGREDSHSGFDSHPSSPRSIVPPDPDWYELWLAVGTIAIAAKAKRDVRVFLESVPSGWQRNTETDLTDALEWLRDAVTETAFV